MNGDNYILSNIVKNKPDHKDNNIIIKPDKKGIGIYDKKFNMPEDTDDYE